MKADRGTRVLIGIAVVIGVVIDAARVASVKSGRSWSDLGDLYVFAWGLVPYLVLPALPQLTRTRAETIGGVVALVVPDLLFGFDEWRHFVDPLGLLFAPLWYLLFFIPLGVYSVRVVSWLRRRAHGHTRGA